mgnify:CR=1 FL=1
MPAFIDISGVKFGRLTALHSNRTSTGVKWTFRCDCGVEKVLNAALVKAGNTRSCGCLRREITAAARFRDLKGQRFGRLVVLDRLPERSPHKHSRWRCLCDCGQETVTTTLGRKFSTHSCGCITRENMAALGRASKLPNPVSRTADYRKNLKRIRREHPHIAMAERVSRLLCWALSSVGAIKRSATFDLLGYTPADLTAHIERLFVDGMNWSNRSLWHIDHIIPISSARTESDVIRLNQLSNLRPLWAIDNLRKGAR